MASERALQRAAQAWCDPRTETRLMDTELATVFAEFLDEEFRKTAVAQTRVENARQTLTKIRDYHARPHEPAHAETVEHCQEALDAMAPALRSRGM